MANAPTQSAARQPAAPSPVPSRSGPSQSAGAYPRRWLMLPVVLMAMFMAGFDIWAVNVAAPRCSATCT